MIAHKAMNKNHRSRCQAALTLLRRSKFINSEIARKCNLSPQAVSIMNKKYSIRPIRHYKMIVG